MIPSRRSFLMGAAAINAICHFRPNSMAVPVSASAQATICKVPKPKI